MSINIGFLKKSGEIYLLIIPDHFCSRIETWVLVPFKYHVHVIIGPFCILPAGFIHLTVNEYIVNRTVQHILSWFKRLGGIGLGYHRMGESRFAFPPLICNGNLG